jgi:hypothetical protein
MKLKYLAILLAIILGVFGIMAFLNTAVTGNHNVRNGFKRSALMLPVSKLAEKQFQQPIRDIAGVTGDSIFIATSTPGQLLLTNKMLAGERQINLPVTVTEKLTSNFTTDLVFPHLYIYGTNIPCIIEYNFGTQQQSVFKINRPFSRAIMIQNTAILRGFNEHFTDENLRKLNLLTGTVTEENGITDKTGGGGYVTDGLLNYDEQTNTIVYNHFYSNKVLYLDTNLRLLHTGATIDTFRNYTAHAKAVTTAKGVLFSFTSPPKLLSMYSCVDDGRLFIYSRLKADNEGPGQFRSHAIVDVYDITTHSYTGSLYVPTEEGKRFLKFKVYKDVLVAMYRNKVVVYRIGSQK